MTGSNKSASAITMTFPNLRDPSELRSEFNGKVVRYLHADGADVDKDEPYVELEAMKMIMSLRSGEAGKIKHPLIVQGIQRARSDSVMGAAQNRLEKTLAAHMN